MCLMNFFGDVGCEMKKVSWFKKDELFCLIVIVVVIVVFFVIFFVVVDMGIFFLIWLIFG